MEPTPSPPRPTITAADLQKVWDQLQPPAALRPVGPPLVKQRPSPTVQKMIDELLPAAEHEGPAHFERVLVDAAVQLQQKEDEWLSDYVVEALQLAGYTTYPGCLLDYGPRLGFRRYPDETLIVAIDGLQPGEHGPRGPVLFGVGPSKVHFPIEPGGGLVLTRPLLNWQQAIAYEISQRYPL
jgi:hypothetical protein